jgi:hypothetical protein
MEVADTSMTTSARAIVKLHEQFGIVELPKQETLHHGRRKEFSFWE